MPTKSTLFLEPAHVVISLLCNNKRVSDSHKPVYLSALPVGIPGYRRLGNQPADDGYREKYQILTNRILKRKTLWKKKN